MTVACHESASERGGPLGGVLVRRCEGVSIEAVGNLTECCCVAAVPRRVQRVRDAALLARLRRGRGDLAPSQQVAENGASLEEPMRRNGAKSGTPKPDARVRYRCGGQPANERRLLRQSGTAGQFGQRLRSERAPDRPAAPSIRQSRREPAMPSPAEAGVSARMRGLNRLPIRYPFKDRLEPDWRALTAV